MKCVPGESSLKDNPLIQSLERLKQLDLNSKDKFSDEDLNEMMGLFDKLIELCGGNEGSVNAAVATKNGGVELVCSICYKIRCGSKRVLDSCLKTMALLVHGKWFSYRVNLVFYTFMIANLFIYVDNVT